MPSMVAHGRAGAHAGAPDGGRAANAADGGRAGGRACGGRLALGGRQVAVGRGAGGVKPTRHAAQPTRLPGGHFVILHLTTQPGTAPPASGTPAQQSPGRAGVEPAPRLQVLSHAARPPAGFRVVVRPCRART